MSPWGGMATRNVSIFMIFLPNLPCPWALGLAHGPWAWAHEPWAWAHGLRAWAHGPWACAHEPWAQGPRWAHGPYAWAHGWAHGP